MHRVADERQQMRPPTWETARMLCMEQQHGSLLLLWISASSSLTTGFKNSKTLRSSRVCRQQQQRSTGKSAAGRQTELTADRTLVRKMSAAFRKASERGRTAAEKNKKTNGQKNNKTQQIQRVMEEIPGRISLKMNRNDPKILS